VLAVYSQIGWIAIAVGVGVLVVSPLIKKLMHLDTLQDDNVGNDLHGQSEAGLEAQQAGVHPATRPVE
jgi:POT family proton-dependent oligopeptide transporter